MAGADEIGSREAKCRTVLARLGLALHQSGGGYQVVGASTLEAVAGRQGRDGGSMSLNDVEGYAILAVWAEGRAGGQEQLRQAAVLAGWAPAAPSFETIEQIVRVATTIPEPEDPAGWPMWRMMLPHIDALAGRASPEADTEPTAYLFTMAGEFLKNQGEHARAVGHFQRALAYRVRVLGEDHPDTLISRSYLAGAYQAAGDPGRAITLYEQILATSMRTLGLDHPDTLLYRSVLAGAFLDAGDPGRAIPLYEQTLADRQRVLGRDHPDTLLSRSNLAYAYQAAGDPGRAIPLYEQTLADRQRVLGEDHPDTLQSRWFLAGAYQAAGDLGRAIPLYEQALADSVRVLGQDHPDTEIVRGKLAAARQQPP